MSCISARGVVALRAGLAVVAVIGGLLWVSCAPPVMQPAVGTTAATPGPLLTIETTPEPLSPAEAAGPSAAAPATAVAGGPLARIDLDALLPPGRGRDLLLTSCGSCHSLVCALRGQRSAGHWENLKQQHTGRLVALPEEDYNTLFAYLTENVSDKNPEPELPPLLAERGCGAYSH